MKPIQAKLVALAAATACLCSASYAQWDIGCIDPGTQNPYPGYGVEGVGTNLMVNIAGVTGAVIYGDAGTDPPGDDNLPCYVDQRTINIAGRFAFGVGATGTVQDDSPADPANANFRDDFMAYTWGFPDPIGCFAFLSTDGARAFIGGPYSLAFTGVSNRYYVLESTVGDIFIHLVGSVVGDAAVLDWTFTNTNTTTVHSVGMWFAGHVGMFLINASDRNGASAVGVANLQASPFFTTGFKNAYIRIPGQKAMIVDKRFQRNADPGNFPDQVPMMFGQTSSYGGFVIDNGPTPATTDPKTGQSDVSQVDEFVIGDAFFIKGNPDVAPAIGDFVFGDIDMRADPGWIQKYPETSVAPNGGTKRLIQFVRSSWGVSNYVKPYSIVVDAPKLVAVDTQGGQGSANGLRPNPMTLRVYIDNFNYAEVNKEIALNNVSITLDLPQGLTITNGSKTRRITQVLPNSVQFIDFEIEADGLNFGALQYKVTVDDPITQTPRELIGNINVAATPRLNLLSGANLITVPWDFADTSVEAVLAPLTTPADFTVFRWDPQQLGYTVASTFERGRSYFIVVNTDFPNQPLSSNPTVPGDIISGFLQLNLKSGWNLIGNPYPYPIEIGQLVGVTAANPQNSFTWNELVQQGVVSGFLAKYDANTGDYSYVQGNDGVLQANTGYWVYVGTVQDLTVSYPAVFHEALPGSFRGVNDKWTQSADHWRLQIAARTNKTQDSQNYVGRAKNAADAKSNTILEPPMAFGHDVQLSIEEIVDGKPTRLAQGLTSTSARKSWKVVVTTQEASTVNLSWPNLATVPKNVQFRLIDTASGETRNLRQTSGYTFSTSDAATRTFTLEMESGQGGGPAVIGNVVVSGGDRGGNVFSISYTLSRGATTTVRILSGSGKEIFTASRGRADNAGENTVTWAMRDNANRLVAPGSYRAEILAETANGERARRVVPLNVIR